MRHRLQHKLFDGKKSKSRFPSTFINMLHSKSTYFYRWESKHLSGLSYVVPSVCGLALVLGGIAILNPIISGQALANSTETAGGSGDSSDTGSGGYNPSIKVTFPESISNQSTNALVGSMAYLTSKFNIQVDDVDGYNIHIQAAPGSTGQLIGTVYPTETIGGVGSGVLPENFEDNRWGYSLKPIETSSEEINFKTLEYSTMPSASDLNLAYASTATTDDRDFLLAFAAKFGSDKPSDHYHADVLLSVSLGAAHVAETWDDLVYMQSMTTEICKDESVEVGATKQLVDIRDGKSYWVAKLSDGNCWMTQNLDLDLSDETILRPATTDIRSNWVAPNTTVKTFLSDWQLRSSDSYDPGMYVYTTPTKSAQCKPNDDYPNNLEECVGDNYKWQRVDTADGWVASTEEMGFDENGDPIVIDLENKVYDAHYLVGNYYTWVAASAGVPYSAGSTSKSICPKGWAMPISGDKNGSNNALDGAFYNMLSKYGLTSYVTSGANDIRKAPLYFLYGGGVYGEKIREAGSTGVYRARTASNTTARSYLLAIVDSAVSPYFVNGDWDQSGRAISIRCLAR